MYSDLKKTAQKYACSKIYTDGSASVRKEGHNNADGCKFE